MSRKFGTPIVFAVLALGLTDGGARYTLRPARGADPASPADPLEPRFATRVRPFLQRYCVSCHGPKKPKAQLDLSRDTTVTAVANNARRWEQVLERLQAGEMPPEDAPRQPTADERAAVIAWIGELRDREARRNAGDPGPVLARRLSNAEFDYTIRDLTGVDIRPTREFPVDPANEAGFDNSGESLAMSPALLKKYLAAARRIADHVVLKPDGFVFAPHPAVTDTDRDKYCVQRIVDFYERHKVDYADYFLAAWKYRHRDRLGRSDAELDRFAAEAGLSAKYLSLVWSALTDAESGSGTAGRRPDDVARTAAARAHRPTRLVPAASGCATWSCVCAGSSSPRSASCTSRGFPTAASRSSCGEIANWRAGIAVIRERFSPTSASWPNQLQDADAGLAKLFAANATDAEAERRLRRALERFCAVFPDAFVVADRGPYFDPNAAGQGRPLTAGFHLMQGYFRDDEPLCELILDERQRRELDSAVARAEFRHPGADAAVQGFHLLRAGRAAALHARGRVRLRPLRGQGCHVRGEDGSAGEGVPGQGARAGGRRRGAGGDRRPISPDMSAEIRRVERARLAAEPSHLDAAGAVRRAGLPPASVGRRTETICWRFIARSAASDDLGHEEALRDTLVTVLLSPHFCYRFDLAEARSAVRPLSDYELASRLSYFLWSSMPDAELLAHAAAGDLHRPDVLTAQARRMLRDPRAARPGDRVCRQLARFPPLRGAQQRRSPTLPELHQRAAAGDV